MKVEILTENQAVKTYDYLIEVKVYEEGTQLVPSLATITVKDPSGSAQITDVDMAIASGGTMTYTLDSGYTAKLWEDAIIEVEYTLSSVAYKAVFFFDVVLNKLKCSVIDADLQNHFPALIDEIWSGSTYDNQIQEAFRLVKRDIKNKGKRPTMLIDGEQIRELIITKTFEIIFRSFMKAEDDKFWLLYMEYKDIYSDKFKLLLIKYDESESGTIEESERRKSMGQTVFLR